MKTTTVATLTIALSALLAGQAMASNVEQQSKTRAQVRAELLEAIRTGDMPASSKASDDTGVYSGTKLNELFPARYPAKQAVAGKTREQVRAELLEAIRTGDMPAPSEVSDDTGVYSGTKLNDVFPARYPAKQTVAGKTREQVRNELMQSRREAPTAEYPDLG
jgi:Tfp pilus assembly protein PilV